MTDEKEDVRTTSRHRKEQLVDEKSVVFKPFHYSADTLMFKNCGYKTIRQFMCDDVPKLKPAPRNIIIDGLNLDNVEEDITELRKMNVQGEPFLYTGFYTDKVPILHLSETTKTITLKNINGPLRIHNRGFAFRYNLEEINVYNCLGIRFTDIGANGSVDDSDDECDEDYGLQFIPVQGARCGYMAKLKRFASVKSTIEFPYYFTRTSLVYFSSICSLIIRNGEHVLSASYVERQPVKMPLTLEYFNAQPARSLYYTKKHKRKSAFLYNKLIYHNRLYGLYIQTTMRRLPPGLYVIFDEVFEETLHEYLTSVYGIEKPLFFD